MRAAPRPPSAVKTRAIARRAAHPDERHVQQFHIALLELEKARRLHERLAARARVRRLDERLQEIEAQVRTCQSALGMTEANTETTTETRTATTTTPPAERKGAATAQRRTLRY